MLIDAISRLLWRENIHRWYASRGIGGGVWAAQTQLQRSG